MFGISFTELMIIGTIALIVIGPERLPKVARTIGHLVGRAQRYVSDVKTDIQREIDLEKITDLKDQVQDAAKSVKESVDSTTKSIKAPMTDAKSAIEQAQATINSFAKSTQASLEQSQAEIQDALQQAKDNAEPNTTPAIESSPQPDLAANQSPKDDTLTDKST